MKTSFLAFAALLAVSASAQTPTNETRVQRDTYTSSVSRTASQVDERKFISVGMSRSTVLSKLGEPDRRIVWIITRIDTQTQFQEPHTDIYEPAKGDEQTRTRIRYEVDTVQGVSREVVR